MKLLEHQATALFASYGIPIPEGRVCRTAAEVESAYEMVGPEVVLKAQVPAGRRGKEGGIWLGSGVEGALAEARRLLSSHIRGYPVKELLMEERVAVERELYLSVLTDTAGGRNCPMVMVSPEGGVDIEELASTDPASLHTVHVDPCYGLLPYQARRIVRASGLSPGLHAEMVRIMEALYRAYIAHDAELVEINPLVVAASGDERRLLALDAKMSIDNAATYRHPEIEGAEVESVETYAASLGLSYVELDGTVGLISNGAGLTMATMDHLALLGASPANFLDTGERILRGGVPDAFGILLANPRVKVILINIFGGGVRCDVIAQKLIEAAAGLPEGHPPVVVSLNGRNDEEGRRMLADAALSGVEVYPTIDEAIATAAAQGAGS